MRAFSRAELRAFLVERHPDDHKRVFGHVLVAAGSRGMAGAAVLCARAVLRSGAGLATLAVPAGLQAAVAPAVPEALTLGLPENSTGALRPEAVGRLKAAHKEKGFTALALGPGLSRHADTARFVVGALGSLPLPAVVDADALNLLSEQEPREVSRLLGARRHPCVLTPHPGEMARCLGLEAGEVQADREGSARRLAREWGAVAVLKGRQTVIADGKRACVNATGGPGLAKGGTGDVLAGLIAGLWSQMLASGRVQGDLAFQAAALGVWLHGAAGDLSERSRTPWAMTASDVIEGLPEAFRELGSSGRAS